MKRLFARQSAVELDEITEEIQSTVSGGGSWTPTVPGGDIEIMPGLYGLPYEPEPQPGPGCYTLAVGEGTGVGGHGFI